MKGLRKPASGKLTDSTSWIKENEIALSHRDEARATTKIILNLMDYAERKGMSQSELARKLGVTPQYIHKLFHGQDSSFRIETALEYGEKLGITLLEVPDDTIDFYSKSLLDFEPIVFEYEFDNDEYNVSDGTLHSAKWGNLWQNQPNLNLSFAS